jgi:uncharacterized protein (TIGR00288 family)
MSNDRVMLLIDADNVSVDVMEQAVRLLLNQHGGLHVRRAYCTAESAVANQAAFKRLGIKPMVNLAAGKNSTDIALAVDAIDLVLAERPDVVVIASSDSDFAPLVHRLREKGCVVRGVGQLGKVGDETQDVYDDFTVLEHHKSSPGPSSQAAAKTAARKTPARKAAARTTTAAKSAAAKKAPAAKKVAAKKAAAKSTPRKSAARKTAAAAPPDVLPEAPVAPPAPAQTPGPAKATEAQSGRSPVSVQAVLDCLPELSAGKSLAMNVAVQRLREAQLLGRNTTSSKLFAQLSHVIELLPPGKPTQLRLRAG